VEGLRGLKGALTAGELACLAGSVAMILTDHPSWPFQIPFAALFFTHATIVLRERRRR
jgi:hypothetical protein